MPIYSDVCKTIGSTPVVKLNRLAPPGVEMYAKLEYFNPLASVKDRLAVAVIEDAEKTGKLKPGQTVVEATSGNTGIALAMVCAVKGYPFVATMVETFSVERRKIMKALGAKVVLTPAAEKGTGMVKKAEELAEKNGWFKSNQFGNPANPAYHANTTGPEILLDFKGRNLDYYVSGFGTGGTISGAGKMIKQARPDTKVIITEPSAASMLTGAEWKPHKIQGWSPDFIADNLDQSVYDKVVPVTDDESIQGALDLASKEGIFCGISGGGTFAAALKTAQEAPKGSTILFMVPDTAERYISTPLFAGISETCDEKFL